MTERQKTDLSPQKRSLKLTPALGDWTTYKPARSLIKRVKSGLYGFDRLSKSELEIAHEIHYSFAQKLCETIKIELGIRGEAYVVDALQTNYSNFIRMLSQPLVEGTIDIEELHEDVFFSVDLSLANTIINHTLGSTDQESIQRELTEAEYKILNSTLSNYIKLYNESFSGILLNPKLKLENSPQVNPSVSISPSQSFICFIIEIKLNESYGKIVCGYSGKALKQLIEKVKKQSYSALKMKKLSPQIIGQIHQELMVKLGSTQITSREINSLEVGDVLSIDQSIFSALSGYLGGKEILLGQPGINNDKVALKIVSVSKEQARIPEIKVAPPPVEEKEEEKEEVVEEKAEPEEGPTEEVSTEEIPIEEESTLEQDDIAQTEETIEPKEENMFEDEPLIEETETETEPKPEEEFEKEYPEEDLSSEALADEEYGDEEEIDDDFAEEEDILGEEDENFEEEEK